MIGALMPHTVEVVEYTDAARDELGRRGRVEVARRTYRALLEQRGTVEDEAFVADAYRLALPPGAVITAGSEVIEGGRRFTVEGSPNRMALPGFPALDRIEVALKLVGSSS